MEVFYTVYKTINTINNMTYIGVHKTSDLNDGYMGSGKYLKRAIEKYGIENFTKEILEIFENSEDMFNMESILVNEDFVSSKDTYNLKEGGFGGFDYLNSSGLNKGNKNYKEITKQMTVLASIRNKELWQDDVWAKNRRKQMSTSQKKRYDEGGDNGFKNKTHKEETKDIIGMKNSLHQKGKGNSQYGSMWIHNIELKESKKIPKGDIPDGWLKGGKMKF